MLMVFADESKTAEKHPVIAVGGGVGTGLQWTKLSKAWREAKKNEPDVDVFHSVEFETPEGRLGTVYENWDTLRLNRFNAVLIDAICANKVEKSFVFTIRPEDFDQVKASRKKRYPRNVNPYTACAYMLIEQTALWADDYFPNCL